MFRFRSSFSLCLCIGLLLVVGSSSLNAQDLSASVPDFNRDVRPILSNHCFACHGQDAPADRVRLDQQELAWNAGAVVPGDTNASLLVERIHSADPDQRMPPDDTGKPLTDAQKQILTQWIQNGADMSHTGPFAE